MIPRYLTSVIKAQLRPGFVIGLFGARRTGKTFIMEQIKNDLSGRNVLMVHGEDLDVAEILSSSRLSLLKRLTAGYDFLFIDEAQQIRDIGNNLKLIVDAIPQIALFVTGSSSFSLKQKIGEPLTGRSLYFYLYPVSQMELKEDFLTSKENLHARLIYGSYPQVIMAETDIQRKEILNSIKNGVLLRDILELDNLKDSLFVINLLRLVAFQIGNDVSVHELSKSLGVSKNTVARYLELLEKSYILFSLQSFSRNLRNEITKSRRYYFIDNGIRNAVISNFNPVILRDDMGRLWENYCISERIRRNHYLSEYRNYYFWRTYQQKEIDFIEEYNGQLFACEMKWKEQKAKLPSDFAAAYPNSQFRLVSQDNYLDFIT